MKCLSINQPFADLINSKIKTIETRKWRTNYRGDILICSSLKQFTGFVFINNESIDCKKYINEKTLFGYSICLATLIDCQKMTLDDEKNACCQLYDNAYSWFLQNIRSVDNIKIKGQLGLFNYNPSISLNNSFNTLNFDSTSI